MALFDGARGVSDEWVVGVVIDTSAVEGGTDEAVGGDEVEAFSGSVFRKTGNVCPASKSGRLGCDPFDLTLAGFLERCGMKDFGAVVE